VRGSRQAGTGLFTLARVLRAAKSLAQDKTCVRSGANRERLRK